MLNLQIIAGTTRPGRFSKGVADWVYEEAEKSGRFKVELIDLKEVNLPLFDEPHTPMSRNYTKQHTKDWSEIINRGDAYIFVTGEYDHGIPAVLKNAIDYLFHEWNNKTAGFVGYGSAGGVRAVEHLRQVLSEVKIAHVRDQVRIDVWKDRGEDGKFIPTDKQERVAASLFDQLEAWGGAMKKVRENTKNSLQ